mmetsp:Transcript_45385/g.50519  ORF Transcript_45385/g.50519 Transcript_45385/m.50519 type:complete len:355 (-) Transcript_45385:255-1319(-)
MATITSSISNFMWRRNAERLETEEPDEEDVSDNNSITEEEHDEEGEFVGVSNSFAPILESLPEDEEVNAEVNGDADEEPHPGSENIDDNISTSASAAEPATTAPATLISSRERISVSRIRGFTLRDLEEEREIVQRRTGACVLLSSFLLLRLWIQAVMTGDFGLLLLCLVFTSWTARFVRYTREREEELNRMINDWDENAEEEESTSANDPRLRRMSFQSQLALAVMQSQIQMMEGGYGHPDGGESSSGVGDDAKSHWDRFEYKTMASLVQRGHYGSVGLDKDGEYKNDVTKNIEEKPQCSICLCEYEKGDKIVSLPCKHVFHDDCITSWTDNNTRCPLCNSDLELSVSGDEVV